jgi:hypothetical protein
MFTRISRSGGRSYLQLVESFRDGDFPILEWRSSMIKLQLSVKEQLPSISLEAFDPELDDVRSILAQLCEKASGSLEFSMSGFGLTWPVDAQFDLPPLLEQFPEVSAALDTFSRFEVDFYEQGIERKLEFCPDNEVKYNVNCKTLFDEKIGHQEVCSLVELKGTFWRLKSIFCAFIAEAAPESLEAPCLKEWLTLSDFGNNTS